MNTLKTLVAGLLVVVALCGSAEGAWKWPWSQTPAKPTGRPSAGELLNSNRKSEPAPGMLAKMTNGTKQAYSRTKAALTPGSSAEPAKTVSTFPSERVQNAKAKGSSFWNTQETSSSKSLKDFMRSPRVKAGSDE